MPLTPLDLVEMENCVLELHRVGVLKFGEFVLKSGIKSPIYFDLRIIVSYPEVLETVSKLLWKTVSEEYFDLICGVPYTALPIATVMSVNNSIPMVIRRKEAKGYGLKKLVEGEFSPQEKCLVVEDVVVSGSSVLETVNVLKDVNLSVSRAVVFLDREQGGIENLADHGIKCTPVFTLRKMLNILHKHKKIEAIVIRNVSNYLESHRTASALPTPVSPAPSRSSSLKERINAASHPLTQKLLKIIEEKKTNLCVAVDFKFSDEVLGMADLLGPHICVLKTHIDIMEDFSIATSKTLRQLALKHNFLIMEDRKFADIGNTVRLQYTGGIFGISSWAHIVTVHGLPGPGVIQGLKEHAQVGERGCVLVAEMSSKGTLTDEQYAKSCAKMAEAHPDFVLGFVSQSAVHENPNFLLFTPGVNLMSENDTLAQTYVTPEVAVLQKGADVVIVGRGITGADDALAKALEYKQKSYKAMMCRSSQGY